MIDQRITSFLRLAEKYNADLKLVGELELDIGSLKIISSIDIEGYFPLLLSFINENLTVKIGDNLLSISYGGKELEIHGELNVMFSNVNSLIKAVKSQLPMKIIYHGKKLSGLEKVSNLSVRKVEYFEDSDVIRINDLVELANWDEACLINILMYLGDLVLPLKVSDCKYYLPVLPLIVQSGGVFEKDFAEFRCHLISPPDLKLVKFMLEKNLANCYQIIGGNFEDNLNSILYIEKKYRGVNVTIRDGKPSLI